jgi:DNA-nicking Smr family endonuclease
MSVEKARETLWDFLAEATAWKSAACASPTARPRLDGKRPIKPRQHLAAPASAGARLHLLPARHGGAGAVYVMLSAP